MMQPGKKVSELDKNVIRALQGDFPLVEEPYKELAARAGVSEEVFLARVKEMTEQKMIRNAWAVPPERLDEVAKAMATSASVSHCYDRNVAPGWPYNLYTMIHAHSRAECEQIADCLGRENHVSRRVMLYSKKEWKKTSMQYFSE